MLDITFIRDNKDLVLKAIQDKKTEPVDLDRVLSLYDKRKELRTKLSELGEKRNKAAEERNVENGRNLKGELQALQSEHDALEKEFVQEMIKIPNIPSPDTPVGEDESGNKVLREIGKPPAFSFEAKPHWELGKTLDLIDSEKAAEVSGARFTYLKGDLARLQYALLDLSLKTLTDKKVLEQIARDAELDVSVTAFIPVVPPVMMKSAVMNRMARLHPIEDRYYLKEDDLVLIGSAEHTLGPLHMDEVLDEKQLPIRYVGYSTAFRREAGSYGKDTRGILRLHQFDKVEMETFVSPEDSFKEQDFLVAIQEYLMKQLGLPYRVVVVCTGEMGGPDQRQIDLETWMPGQKMYRETHSADLIGGYQPRRLNTRVRRGDGKLEHLHMNDATAIAMGRTLIAILENYQQEDGSIAIPHVLRPQVGKDAIIKT